MAMNTEQAACFLMQASLGSDYQTIQQVSEQGAEHWLDSQLNSSLQPDDRFYKKTSDVWQYFRQKLLQEHGIKTINGEGNNPALPYKYYFRMAWWDKTLSLPANSDALLRHRVALALSEILVISENSQLELDALAMGNYYDILYRHAFGSYQDMLQEVSMNPCMGVYLSHMNNQKADSNQNIHPDENYAREIMQLFSIGLYELNMDGSRKKDSQGRDIPTYDNRDIKVMARIFTGLKAASYRYEWKADFFPYTGDPIQFNDGVSKAYKTIPFVDMVKPMVVDEIFHDKDSKRLLKGRIDLPARQKGEQDIREAVNALVAHPSTAPFIAHKLIQQLVTSNPSPEYIQAVAEKFGPKGDMKAVIKAILLHPESRRPKKLKAPVIRVTQILRAFNASNVSGKYWLTGDDIKESLSQLPLASPTVFNFYKPDYAPQGVIENKGLVAPEFELHNASTSVAYINTMYTWIFGEYLPLVSTEISREYNNIAELDPERLEKNDIDRLGLNFKAELKLARAGELDQLIERMSLILTGSKDCLVKREIKQAINNYPDEPLWVVQTIAFMITISPQFAILEAAA